MELTIHVPEGLNVISIKNFSIEDESRGDGTKNHKRKGCL